MIKMNNLFAIPLIIAGIVISPAAIAIEKPEYEVVLEVGKVEYRKYKSYIIAETEVVDVEDWNDAANEGFARLFDYITGDNNGAEKISMTAPVQQSKVRAEDLRLQQTEQLADEQGWKISFMLPSSYSLTDAPAPEDDRIVLRMVPEKTVAALRYSGRWTERNFDKYASRLMEALAEDDVETRGTPESAVYNPPFMPAFMRRNEVLVEVASLPQ